MSKNRFIRMVALAGCSVLIGALGYTPSATAHIGASHSPFNTDLPDMLTASIVGGTTVRACFDVSIDEIVDETYFETRSYDAFDTHDFAFSAGDGAINPDNDKCVDLDASANESLDQARMLEVGGNAGAAPEGAVQDVNDNGNSGGTVALTGGVAASAMKETDAPELLTAARVGTTERVRFAFDENIDTGDAPDFDEFGFEPPVGDDEFGTAALVVDDNEVEITFDGTPSVGTARQFFVMTESLCNVDDNAVWDLGITDVAGPNTGAKMNVLDTIGTGSPANRTDDPDVTGVTVADGNRLNYAIDERIEDVAPAPDPLCFVAYEADGDSHEGTDVDVISNTAAGATLQVDFAVNGESDQLVIAAADEGAVAADDDGDFNSRASFDLSDRLEAGFSDGPDLEQIIPNISANRMTFCFDTDETLDPASIDDEGDFNLNKKAGTAFDDNTHAFGDTFLGTGPDNCVTIGYVDDGPDAVKDAIAAHVADDPVTDLLPDSDNDNRFPASSEGSGNEAPRRATVGVGGPPPTVITPPPTPPGPPGPPAPGPTGCPPPYKKKAGNAKDNKIKGSSTCDKLVGKGGDDKLIGKGEEDKLIGGAGFDICRGGAGKDIFKKCEVKKKGSQTVVV